MKNEILNRFPICKVILKPLIYDHLDHSIDTMFLQRRLGMYLRNRARLLRGAGHVETEGQRIAGSDWLQTLNQAMATDPSGYQQTATILQEGHSQSGVQVCVSSFLALEALTRSSNRSASKFSHFASACKPRTAKGPKHNS